MADALRDHGVVAWFAGSMQAGVAGLSGVLVVVALGVIYFYSMVGFSMLTAHISALGAAFLGVALAAKAPPLLAVAVLAPFSDLCACTTNYSTGPLIVYYGLGYVPASTWFRVGFLVSLLHLAVWFGVGLAWWKLLGWW
jgi:DASS family divalent anion:Na+ symporter